MLGDPLKLDAANRPKDYGFALHWLEVLTLLGMVSNSPSAKKALTRLLNDCDKKGVWSPRALKAFPKSANKLGDFAFPLELDVRTKERKQTDVTFRLALMAKSLGAELEYT